MIARRESMYGTFYVTNSVFCLVIGVAGYLSAWVVTSVTAAIFSFVGISSMMGSVNYMTTIIQMRAPGMTMFRLPMTIWGMFITAVLQAFALPVLTTSGNVRPPSCDPQKPTPLRAVPLRTAPAAEGMLCSAVTKTLPLPFGS